MDSAQLPEGDGMLLIGVDTKNNEEILDPAYNDVAGITALFNLNLIHRYRSNGALNYQFDPRKPL